MRIKKVFVKYYEIYYGVLKDATNKIKKILRDKMKKI